MARKKKASPPASPRKLTDLQERFVREYLFDRNGSAAYKRAGYKAEGNAAEVNASRLLRNAQVQAAIAKGEAELAARTNVKAEDVLRELKLIGFSDIGQFLDFSGNEPRLKPASAIAVEARKALSSVKVKRYTEGHGDDAREVEVTEFRLWDKLSALEKLGKHLGLWKETPPPPPASVLVHLTYEELKKLPPDELVRIHRQTLGLPAQG